MASIILRQDVDESWEHLPEPTRDYLRENIVPKLQSSRDLQVASNLEDLVESIARVAFPQAWSDALLQIGEGLAGDEGMLFGSLCALRGIVRVFKTSQGLERVALVEIVSGAFPVMEGLLERLCSSPGDKEVLLLTVMIKIFYLANYVVVPSDLRSTSPQGSTIPSGSAPSMQS